MPTEFPPAPCSSTPHPKFLDEELTRSLPTLDNRTRRLLIEAARADIERAHESEEDHNV
jgi:hypothetical protein